MAHLADMRRRRVNPIRVAAAGCLAAGALLSAAGDLARAVRPAPAADFAPRLRAELGRHAVKGPALILDVTQRARERRLARVTFVAPAPGLALPPPGRRVGDAAVAVKPIRAGSGARVVLSGALHTIRPPAGCVGGARAALRATLEAHRNARSATRRLRLTMLVHRVRGADRLTACLPTSGSLGASAVRRLSLRLEHGARAPSRGRGVWRALVTPAGADGRPAARRFTAESRAIVSAGSFLTLQVDAPSPPVAPRSTVSLGGVLSLGRQTTGRRVRLLGGPSVGALRLLGRTKVGALGTFRFRIKAPAERGTLYLQVRAPSRRLPCRGRIPEAPAGCTGATLAGVSSPVLQVPVG